MPNVFTVWPEVEGTGELFMILELETHWVVIMSIGKTLS